MQLLRDLWYIVPSSYYPHCVKWYEWARRALKIRIFIDSWPPKPVDWDKWHVPMWGGLLNPDPAIHFIPSPSYLVHLFLHSQCCTRHMIRTWLTAPSAHITDVITIINPTVLAVHAIVKWFHRILAFDTHVLKCSRDGNVCMPQDCWFVVDLDRCRCCCFRWC